MTPSPAPTASAARRAGLGLLVAAALACVSAPAGAGEAAPTPAEHVVVQGTAPAHAAAARPRTTRGHAGLPAVLLVVDWRLVTSPPGPARAPGGGTVVVGTDAPAPAGWQAVSSQDAAPPAEVASVQVLNGREVSWRLDDAQSRKSWDFVWTAQGQGVTSRDEVVHDARSLSATPRWPGGRAPVQLDLAVATRQPAADEAAARAAPVPGATGAPQRASAVHTSVAMPLDTWVPVARLGGQDVELRVRRP